MFIGDVIVEIWLFSRHFLMVFLGVPHMHPFITTPIFMQMKGVEVVHMSCKFHLHLTCNKILTSDAMQSNALDI